MKCQARTNKGTKCSRQGWGDWPLCPTHLKRAYDEYIKFNWGNKVRLHEFDNTREAERYMEEEEYE